MNQRINPEGIAPPASRYSHGVVVEPGSRLLFISGQLGIDADNTLASGFENQMRQAMHNVKAVLAEAEMSIPDIVKLTVFVTLDDSTTVESYRRIRDEILGDTAPASLYAVVSSFTNKDFLVEIEAVAAAPVRG